MSETLVFILGISNRSHAEKRLMAIELLIPTFIEDVFERDQFGGVSSLTSVSSNLPVQCVFLLNI